MTVIAIEGLAKSFDGRPVLEGVDLTVEAGTIVSIIGSSGGGKTTLMRCVNLLERPDAATIEVAGEPVFEGTRMTCRSLAKLRRTPEWDYEIANDFPANEWRRVQRAEGYRWTIVNGEVTFEDGQCTGATSGRLLRNRRIAEPLVSSLAAGR